MQDIETDPEKIREAHQRAERFTKEHIKELAAEIVEWHDTSLLKIGGRVRELAQILQTLDKSKSLSIAENMINREALKIVANQ